ncbi:hypothetical protein WN943_001464 [Citrus x changshan-huyou]
MEAERCYHPIPKAEDQAQAVKPLAFLHLMMVSYSFGECIGVFDDFANLAIETRLEANGYLMYRFTGHLSLSIVLAL